MKKIEKKLMRAIHDATFDGRLEWEYNSDGPFFHASLLDATGSDYRAIIQDDYARITSIHSASGDFVHVIRPSTIEMRPTASRILEHAKNSQTEPKVILNGIANALMNKTPPHHSDLGA